MYKVKVNGVELYFGKDYEAKSFEEILQMVLDLSKSVVITELIIVKE